MNHTPGPWTVQNGPRACIAAQDGSVLARVNHDTQSLTDASLMAAAPDLLAACRSMISLLGGMTSNSVPSIAFDALAKAEGRGQ